MDPRIDAVLKLIHTEGVQNLSVGEIAKRVRLSPWRFSHLFRAELSVSPKQYLREYRLRKSQELLANSFLTVKEVAAALGFADTSHFSRDFKKAFGQTPSEFRESNRNVPQHQ